MNALLFAGLVVGAAGGSMLSIVRNTSSDIGPARSHIGYAFLNKLLHITMPESLLLTMGFSAR